MSPEAKPSYPCLVDLRRNCDYRCKLIHITKKILENAAKDKRKSTDSYLASLRSEDPEAIEASNRLNISMLVKADHLDSCRLVKNGELNPQIPRK